MIDGFLLGVVTTGFVTAGVFFFRFWRITRDGFFLAFAAAFIIEGLNRASTLLLDKPNEGAAAIYSVRLLSLLLILGAILKKNYGEK
jgi:hypothetical protein